MYRIHDRLRNAAGDGKLPCVGARLIERLCLAHGDTLLVDALGCKHSQHLLKGEDKVHVAADVTAAGFKLLCVARSDENDLAAGVLLLYETCRDDHGRERNGDVLRHFGEELLHHVAPRGAAGGDHEGVLRRHLGEEVARLLLNAEVCADGDLVHSGKAETLKRRLHFFGDGVGPELTDEGGSERNVNGNVALYRHDGLEDLTLVGDGAEGAVCKALTAGGAFAVVDVRSAMFVRADAVNAAVGFAGALLMNYRMELTLRHALCAADAAALIYLRLAVCLLADRLFGAELHAWMLKAGLTAVGYGDDVVGAFVTGKFDDVYERRLIVFFRNDAFLDAVGNVVVNAQLSRGQTHRKAKTLADDGSFKHKSTLVCARVVGVAGTYFIWKLLKSLGVISTLICKACDLGKNLVTYYGFAGLHSSH